MFGEYFSAFSEIMFSAGAVAGLASIGACLMWACCFFAFLRLSRKCSNKPENTNSNNSNQQEDIFNISSRVQGQGQWPTHDAHVSLDHFTISNELNKYNDAPPTYEEAMRIAASMNNNTVVPPVAPKTTVASTPTSTSAVTTN